VRVVIGDKEEVWCCDYSSFLIEIFVMVSRHVKNKQAITQPTTRYDIDSGDQMVPHISRSRHCPCRNKRRTSQRPTTCNLLRSSSLVDNCQRGEEKTKSDISSEHCKELFDDRRVDMEKSHISGTKCSSSPSTHITTQRLPVLVMMATAKIDIGAIVKVEGKKATPVRTEL
jgi:hypothetical protein